MLPLPGGTSAVTDVKILIVEGGGLNQLAGSDKRTLDLIYGVRFIDLDTLIDITLPLPPDPTTRVESNSSYLDGMLGLRYSGQLSDRWDFKVRFDYAGGDTEDTLNALAGFGCRFGKRNQLALRVAYRHMELEVEEDPVEIEISMSGPLLGFEIGF